MIKRILKLYYCFSKRKKDIFSILYFEFNFDYSFDSPIISMTALNASVDLSLS